MKVTLAILLAESLEESVQFQMEIKNLELFNNWLDKFQTQLICLNAQVVWCRKVDSALKLIESSVQQNDLDALKKVLDSVESILNVLADSVLKDQPALRRKKLEHLVICSYFSY